MFEIKRFLYYFCCSVVIGFIFYLGYRYQVHLKKEAGMTFKNFPVMVFTFVFPIIKGMLLRLPKLIIEIKVKQPWTFDWVKVLAVGLPALYITFLPILAYTFPSMNLLFAHEILFENTVMIITTTGIIFGYTLIDSLKK